MNQPRLLVLDDQESLTVAISYMATSIGWEAVTTTEPEQALAWLKSMTVDVFLTDFRMPRCTGLDLIEALRISQPTLPAILMSACPWEIDTNRADKLNLLPILVKPFDQSVLEVALNRARALAPGRCETATAGKADSV